MLRYISILVLFSSFFWNIWAGELADEIGSNKFTKATVCGECHVKIYEAWKTSLHAYSAKDPIFQTALLQSLSIAPRKQVMRCLSCHAPAGYYNVKKEEEVELMSEDILEGINCDYCHSTSSEAQGKVPSLASSPGIVKYGPFAGLESPAHKVQYNPLFKKAEFCKSCHEYWNGSAGLLTTYTEWQESAWSKEGKQCQDCHMPYVEGELVDPSVKKSRTRINLHAPPGGRSPEQLRKSASLRIQDKIREGDKYTVTVMVENIGAGHKLPTGIPSRFLILEFTAETIDGKTIFTDNYKFMKAIGDKKGEQLFKDYEIMLRGEKVLSDNRLAPKETRIIPFTFYAPVDGIIIKTKLFYVYEPYVISRETMKVEVGSIEEKLH